MASKRIKGITIEIGGDTTKLQDALKSVDRELSTTQSSLRDVERLLKLDPGNAVLLQQQQKLLADAIEQTKERLETLRGALTDDLPADQYAALQREIIATEQSLSAYESQAEGAASASNVMGDEVQEAGEQAKASSEGWSIAKDILADLAEKGIQAAMNGLRNLAGAFKESVTASAGFADEIQTLSQQTGISTDTLQEYAYMAELVDTDVSTITGSMTKLTRNMNNAKKGTGDAAAAFEKLGISITDSNGNLRSNQEVFMEVIDALGDIENQTERDATAMEIFGRSAQELNPLIDVGADEIKAYAKEARDMGAVLNKEALGALGKMDDSFRRLEQAGGVLQRQLGLALAPAVTGLTDALVDLSKDPVWNDVFEELGEVVAELAPILVNLVREVLPPILSIIRPIMDALRPVIELLTTLMSIILPPLASLFGELAKVIGVILTPVIDVLLAPLKILRDLFGEVGDNAKESVEDMYGLSDAQKSLVDSINQEAEAWGKAKEAREEAARDVQTEYGYYQQLSDELKTIVDENGNIIEGYEDRADFIINELSEALGIEIEAHDGIIESYQSIQEEIDKTIEKQRQEALLAIGREQYNEAIKNSQKAYENLTKAQEEANKYYPTWQKAQDKLATAAKAVEEYTAKNLPKVGSSWKIITVAMEKAEAEAAAADAAYYELTEAVSASESQYLDYQNTIENYNGAMAAQARGDVGALDDAISKLTNNFRTSTNSTREMLQEQTNNFRSQYESMKKAVEQGMPGVTQEQVTQMKKLLDASEAELKKLPPIAASQADETARYMRTKSGKFAEAGQESGKAYADGVSSKGQDAKNAGTNLANQARSGASSLNLEEAGKNFGNGFAIGINKSAIKVVDAAETMTRKAIQKVNYVMAAGSPSKLLEKTSGKWFDEGFAIGIEKNARVVESAAQMMTESAVLATQNAQFGPGTMADAEIMTGAGAAGDVNYGGFNIVINATEGQSPDELYDVFESRINQAIRSKQAVWA